MRQYNSQPDSTRYSLLLAMSLLAVSSVLTADDAVTSRAVRKPIPDKLVVLTFDDTTL